MIPSFVGLGVVFRAVLVWEYSDSPLFLIPLADIQPPLKTKMPWLQGS